MARSTLLCLALAGTGGGCDSDGGSGSSPPDAGIGAGEDSSTDAGDQVALEPGRPKFCARSDASADPIREHFCAGPVRTAGSLRELQAQLGFVAEPPSTTPVQFPLFLGHSTSLAGHKVSSINPRVIAISPRNLMAFQRGVQQVELVGRTQDVRRFNFYLVRFTQRCNERPEGCVPGELYTPLIESDWTSFEIADDEDLKNGPSDCRQCHQRGRETPLLLMRERVAPWTHFFDPLLAEGEAVTLPGVLSSDLMQDYLNARGPEPYANVDPAKLPRNGGAILERAAGRDQPLVFDSLKIQNERWPFGPDGYPEKPLPSPTWEAAFEAFKRGEQLALPYLEPRATDPDKLAKLSEAYTDYREGRLDVMDLPDLSDIFPDDPRTRAQIGLQTEPEAGPVDALIQACASCHNDVLDQTISRARFSVDLSRLDEVDLERAIERVEREPHAPGAMPPPEARQLDPQARQRLLEYLRTDARSGTAVEELTRAAMLGMSGGATSP